MLDAGIQLAERIENYIPDAYVLELQGLLRVHKHPHLYGAMVGVCSFFIPSTVRLSLNYSRLMKFDVWFDASFNKLEDDLSTKQAFFLIVEILTECVASS